MGLQDAHKYRSYVLTEKGIRFARGISINIRVICTRCTILETVSGGSLDCSG